MSWLFLPSLKGFRKTDGATRDIIETAGGGGTLEKAVRHSVLLARAGIGGSIEVG